MLIRFESPKDGVLVLPPDGFSGLPVELPFEVRYFQGLPPVVRCPKLFKRNQERETARFKSWVQHNRSVQKN